MPNHRKPRAQKILQGTFRKDRNPKQEPQPEGLIDPPPAPRHLDRYGKQMWRRLARDLIDAGLLTSLDMFSLEILCAAYGEYRQAHEAIFRPMDQETGKRTERTIEQYLRGRNAHTAPEITVMKAAFSQYKAMLAEFGLGPASRNRIDVAPRKPEEEDPMIRILEGE